MQNELQKAVTKLLEADKHTLSVTAPTEDSVKCYGIYQDHSIEIYASIRRLSFYELCKTAVEDKPSGHVSISIDGAQVMSTDIYSAADIEFVKDQIYYLIKKLRETASKRGEAWNFLMDATY